MGLLQEQPKRMARERRLLNEHARSTPGFNIEGWSQAADMELALRFRLKLGEGEFSGVLVYPTLFPDVPAYVRPQKSGEAWSRHPYGGSGVLCLQYGPDNWHPDVTGVDLVRSANILLWGEVLSVLKPGLDLVPSRHSATRGQDLRASSRRFLVTAGLRKALSAARNAASLTVVTTYLSDASVVVPTAVGTPPTPLSDVPVAFAKERFEWAGWAVAVPSVDALGAASDVDALKIGLRAAWPWAGGLGDQLSALLLHDPEGGMRAFLLCGGPEPLFREHETVDFGPDAEQRLPAKFSALTNVTVAIAGLGSLGSKIAVSLARSGVGRFLLVDDDILTPHNLVRNELTWFDVGFSKVDSVGRELKRVAMGIDVRTRNLRVGAQENPKLAASLSEELAKCTLVIDATADARAFVALAALTKRCEIPMVWGKVFAGGAGGLIARSRPGIDADALSIRAHVEGVTNTFGPAPLGAARNYDLERDGRVYVASDADVTAMAASMTQFSLDVLCQGDEQTYPFAAYLVGFREYWAFRYPFDTIPIDCPVASQVAAEPEQLTPDEAADLEAIEKSLEEGCGATNHSAD